VRKEAARKETIDKLPFDPRASAFPIGPGQQTHSSMGDEIS
jgi:hypothetical protein